jgi:exopolyphosphatase/pppGpp-phosphohydrolase
MNHDAALAEIRKIANRLEPEPEHTTHVARLALRLFDDLAPLHELGPDERVLLEGAALLHDIGWPVSDGGAAHHKHSARLIREQSWKNLGVPEVECLAQIARYHRKSLPTRHHPEFAALQPRQRQVVRTLAALLRVADALDRSHLQQVRDVIASVVDHNIHLKLASAVTPAREISGVEKKGDLAREVFGKEFTFEVVPPTDAQGPA